jgi:Abortive infection alpha
VSEDPKGAGALIVKEIADVVPEADKEVMGRDVGKGLANAAAAFRDVTALAKMIAAVPRVAGGFALRMIHRWRQVPADRRSAIPPQLLLEASAGYATATDEELRAGFERLVTAAMDRETAAHAHPSFASALSQMTPIDARLIRLIMERPPVFSSFAELGERLGPGIDFVAIGVSANNLQRLGLADVGTPTIIDDLSAMLLDDPKDWTMRFGEVRVEEGDKVISGKDGTASGGHTLRVRYRLTELGLTFLYVVRPPR